MTARIKLDAEAHFCAMAEGEQDVILPFVYVEQFKQLVCSLCHFAVHDRGRHLKDKHQIRIDRRKEILAACTQYEILSPAQITYPTVAVASIDCLGDAQTCYRCGADGCGVIRGNIDDIRKHAYEAHRWRANATQRTLWHPVKAQSLFRYHQLVRFFAVRDEDAVDDAVSNSLPLRSSTLRNLAAQASQSSSRLTTPQQGIAQQFMQKWKVQQEKTEARLQQLENEQATHDRTGWWNLNQWPQHFSNCNLNFLAHYSRLPDKNELLQRNAVEVVNVMLSRAVAGLTSLHREERRWLRSPKVSDPDVRPLARLQEPDSQDRYHNYWRRFICYLLRVWESKQEYEEESRDDSDSEDDEGHSSRGRDLTTPDDSEDDENSVNEETATQNGGATDTLKDARRLVVLTSRQLELLQELNDKLLADEEEVNMDARTETMLELCKTLILCKFVKSEFECPLVHFCAVLGIDGENGRLRRAAAYSYMLAGMVYCVRVLFAESILPSTQTQREEQNEDPTWREGFLKQRVQYLVDGTHTPMSTMISLLAYGKYIAMNEGNAGMISWSQDRQTMYYRGFPISLADFRFMIHDIVARATKLLWEDLMWVKDEQDRWTVPLDKIEDDITFTKRGWSFMSRKENGLDAETCMQWMMDQAARLEGSDQLMNEDGWRKRAVQRYLRVDEEFQELLAIVCHLTEGMLARVKEFLIIRAENGTTQDRGIFVIDGKVVLVTPILETASNHGSTEADSALVAVTD